MENKWSVKYGVRENAECIFPLLLQRFHAPLLAQVFLNFLNSAPFESSQMIQLFTEVLLAESFEKTQKVPSLKSLKKLEPSFLYSLCRNLTMLANIIK